MGCCGSKAEYQRETTFNKKVKSSDTVPIYKAHTIECSDYEYSYTYSDSGEAA